MSWWRRIKKLSALDGYNIWARTYHTESNPIKKMSDDFITENLPSLKGKSVLDAGCGTGKFCVMAVEQGAVFVKGIDLSPVMIDEAKGNCPKATLVCSDLSTAEVETTHYDVVICGLVMAHIKDHEPVLVKLLDSLKRGGVIIITDFHPYQTRNKAKRTFKDDHSGKTFEISHYLHSIEYYTSQLEQSGLTVTSFQEPRFSGNPVIFGIAALKS